MNTLAMTDKLKAAGIPEEEARAHIGRVGNQSRHARDDGGIKSRFIAVAG